MTPFPQVLINVSVRSKPDLKNLPGVAKVIEEVEAQLGQDGRVLVRYSGTEPLCRVMVEGPNQEVIDSQARRICQAIQKSLG
jgi:phosphoglucosamine mutase